MPKRKYVSKKTRFEIFKRDGFTCQYCGNTPPAVILEIDHITPVSKGGDNNEINLITACFDCNRGKTNIPLTAISETLSEKIRKEKERREQVELYNNHLMKIRESEIADIEEVGLYWFNSLGYEKDTKVFAGSYEHSVRRFLKRLPKAKLFEAIDITMANCTYENRMFKYFCAVCWRWIKNGDENG